LYRYAHTQGASCTRMQIFVCLWAWLLMYVYVSQGSRIILSNKMTVLEPTGMRPLTSRMISGILFNPTQRVNLIQVWQIGTKRNLIKAKRASIEIQMYCSVSIHIYHTSDPRAEILISRDSRNSDSSLECWCHYDELHLNREIDAYEYGNRCTRILEYRCI